eukprot:scaffold33711_cov54-Attheya_sp.AAC.7
MALARVLGRRKSPSGRICESVLRLRHSGTTTTTEDEATATTTLESFANLDHGRSRRTGFPEAIFAAGKTPEQIAAILDDMAHHVNSSIQQTAETALRHNNNAGTAILATRVDQDLYDKVSAIPLKNGVITYHSVARIISMQASGLGSGVESGAESQRQNELLGNRKKKRIVVACAGTTDLPVAEEAAVTLEATAGAGIEVERVYDVGVAGLHRIIRALPKLRHENVGCVIVCAGMDGALPSVVAGLVSVPVIAVPTSVGYGAAFGGLSAMGTMLNSCAPGVGVVNIDNGFGAAALAFKCINNDDTHY